ncbi:MAG: hypothetical protein IT529_06340 [Burkholderiales bacterium]|nr:hypothetical protein [Burkholderiales bacterium]
MKELQEMVDMLLARMAAIEFMILGLAIAVAENERTPMSKIVEALEFMKLFARFDESPQTAECFEETLHRLRAAQDFESRPRTAFVLLLANLATTQPRLRDALRTWLAMATPEELAEDLKDLLAKLQAGR